MTWVNYREISNRVKYYERIRPIDAKETFSILLNQEEKIKLNKKTTYLLR